MAINPKIKQKAEDIRSKIFGSEVRESLASGIEAISEDVEATIGRQDYVEEQFQDVLDETTGKDVISAPELIAARNGKSNLKTRLDGEHAQVTAQLQQTSPKGYFVPLKSVNALTFKERTSSEYYALFDAFLSDSRMLKFNRGLDQSGQYSINMYAYTPTNYTSTVFLIGSMHGWEHYGTFNIYKVLELLINDNDLPSQFEKLRNARLIIVPVANPWGLNNTSESQTIRRGNSRGVDLNRNWDWNWSNNSGGFGLSKGTEPFSEAETKILRNIMKEYTINHVVDVHSFANLPAETRDYLFYDNPKNADMTKQLIDWIKKEYPSSSNIEHTTTINDASANNYAAEVLNIPAINIELIRGRHGLDDDRRWSESLINYLRLVADNYNMTNRQNYGGKIVTGAQKTPNNVIAKEWVDIPELVVEHEVATDGLLIVTGFVSVNFTQITTGRGTVTIAPEVSQINGKRLRGLAGAERIKPFIAVTGETSSPLPINLIVPVYKIDGKATFNCKIIHEGNGVAQLARAQVSSAFIPTTHTYAQNDQLVL